MHMAPDDVDEFLAATSLQENRSQTGSVIGIECLCEVDEYEVHVVMLLYALLL